MGGSISQDDDVFSMEDLEKDLKKGRGARRLPWFTGGLVLGVAVAILAPKFLSPYMPGLFGGERELLTGPVLAEQRDGDRLLLTIQTGSGALIASFSERVAEIDLLVEPGDTVTIAVDDYDPFVENPDVEGVRKATSGAAGTATSPAEQPETTPAEQLEKDKDDAVADTVATGP